MNAPDRPATTRPEDFAQIRAVFDAACERETAERRAFVESRCVGNDAVRDAVLGLLRADDRVEESTALGMPFSVRPHADDEAALPERIGPYAVKRLIGRGGMGVVYLAEQSSPHREVAVKLVRMDMRSREVRVRFEREIRVLGRLEHPGITRIYEAGTSATREGPAAYFAMEYVRGPRLMDAAREMNLDVAGRIELAARIADAVQYAHSRGVIHRDLKPANILVTDDDATTAAASDGGSSFGLPPTSGHGASTDRLRPRGPQPKILDFGVARVLETDPAVTAVTESGLLVGTPGYMSPEQFAGDAEAIDSRTDVYSIGVILYELLAGRPPLETSGKPLAEVARVTRDDSPRPLGPLPGFRRSLARDLETILSRAMEKDRDRRYPTAAALADDLRRLLRDEPILARPASAAYQITKFARRNTGLVAGVLTGAAFLVVGLVVTVFSLVRVMEAGRTAETKAAAATAVTEFLTDMLSQANPGNARGEVISVRSVLDRALVSLDADRPFATQPGIEGEVRRTLGKTYASLGEHDIASDQLTRSVALNRGEFGEVSREAASALQDLASNLWQARRFAEARDIGYEVVQLHERLSGPGTVEYASALNNLATTVADLEDFPEAERLLLKAQAIYEARNIESMDSIRTLNNLASVYGDMKRYDEALALHDRVLPLRVRVFGENHPAVATTLTNMGFCHYHLKEMDKAAEVTQRALDLRRRLLPPDHPDIGVTLNNLAAFHLEAGDAERALPALDEALRIYGRLAEDHVVGQLLTRRGIACTRLGRHADAEPDLLEAHRIFLATLGDGDRRTQAAVRALADLYEAWDRPEDAARWRPAPGP